MCAKKMDKIDSKNCSRNAVLYIQHNYGQALNLANLCHYIVANFKFSSEFLADFNCAVNFVIAKLPNIIYC